MAMTVDLRVERLSCGVHLRELLEQVADGHAAERSPHQAACAYCQAALREIALRWAPVQAGIDEPAPIPDGLLSAIISRVRALTAAGRYVVRLTERGSTRIATWVLERIAARAASRVPGVSDVTGQAATVLTEPPQSPRFRIQLHLTGSYDASLPTLSTRVREAVYTDLTRQVGIEPETITVHVDDIDHTRSERPGNERGAGTGSASG